MMQLAEALVRAGYKATPEERLTIEQREAIENKGAYWAPEEWLAQAKLEATHGG